jgi:hypothetical protein
MKRLTGRRDGRAYIVGCPDFALPKIAGLIIQQTVDRLAAIEEILGDEYDIDRLHELTQADREGLCVVLDMPRKPLVWGDDDQDTCLCPDCGKDLMGIPYGERMVLQCPECGQYLDATKAITRAEAEEALRGEQDG